MVAPQQWCSDAIRGRIRRICTGGGECEAWWPVAEGFVGEAADDGVADDPVSATPSAPVIGSVGLAFQNGFVPGDVLANAREVKGVEPAERREIRR